MSARHALIIGNAIYEDPTLARLNAPEADVRALAGLLGDADVGQFDSVRTLIDETESTTRRAIATFFARAGPDDLLLLYFSGHGVLDDQGRLYLAARDTQHDLPQGSAVPAAFITDGMDSSRSRRQVLILDCCHSGAFARGARSASGAKAVTAATFEGVGYGRAVLTATDATQYAWEGDAVIGAAENSVFTQHLIEGLRSGAADSDGDGDITLEELYEYVYARVVKQTPRQTPRKWSYNQEGALILARNPRPPAPRDVPLPPELQQSVDDPRSWVRNGAVQELERLLVGTQPGLAVAARNALERIAGSDDSFSVRAAAQKALAGAPASVSPARASAPERSAPPIEPVGEAAVVPDQAIAREPQSITASVPATSGPTIEPQESPSTAVDDPLPVAATMIEATVTNPPDTRPADSRLRSAILILSLGIALAFFVGTSTFWVLYQSGQEIAASRTPELVVFGLIAGAATTLSLRAASARTRAIPAIAIVSIATVVALLGIWISPALQESGQSIHLSLAWERTLLGTLGGALLAALLYRRGLLTSERVMFVVMGWALGWALGTFALWSIYQSFGQEQPLDGLVLILKEAFGSDVGSALLPWVDALLTGLAGLIAGALSGWVTAHQLHQSEMQRPLH